LTLAFQATLLNKLNRPWSSFVAGSRSGFSSDSPAKNSVMVAPAISHNRDQSLSTTVTRASSPSSSISSNETGSSQTETSLSEALLPKIPSEFESRSEAEFESESESDPPNRLGPLSFLPNLASALRQNCHFSVISDIL
jgi:hypothetical protein